MRRTVTIPNPRWLITSRAAEVSGTHKVSVLLREKHVKGLRFSPEGSSYGKGYRTIVGVEGSREVRS